MNLRLTSRSGRAAATVFVLVFALLLRAGGAGELDRSN